MKISEFILVIVLAAMASMWWLGSTADQPTAKQGSVTTPTPQVAESAGQRDPDKNAIKNILAIPNIPVNDIRDFGYGAIPILTELYSEADTNLDKARIAWVFWRLGWKSPEIEKALIQDLDSKDANLKVQVQWGIAKSTQNNEVIKKLLHNMENDPNPFVRDKAACALASDFVHISPMQRVTILRGLVEGLSNDIQQVRASSIQALKVQTGQTKNYVATADDNNRTQAIQTWTEWVNEYERSL